jgi:hypothetical protein
MPTSAFVKYRFLSVSLHLVSVSSSFIFVCYVGYDAAWVLLVVTPSGTLLGNASWPLLETALGPLSCSLLCSLSVTLSGPRADFVPA